MISFIEHGSFVTVKNNFSSNHADSLSQRNVKVRIVNGIVTALLLLLNFIPNLSKVVTD